MKYKIGDKVKYDGGNWWFYGTISAVFEHSISPCYRLSVERMEKKNCKFSITQFEFELEPDNEVKSDKDKRNWGHSEIEYLTKYYGILNNDDLSKVLKKSPQAIAEKWRQIKPDAKPEPAPEKKQKPEQKLETGTEKTKMIRIRKTTDAWDKNLELFRNGKKSNVLNAWKSKNRKDYKSGILAKDKYEKLMEVNFPFDVDKRYPPTTGKTKREKVELAPIQKKEPSKRKISEVWERNLEEYLNGKKSYAIYNWITSNRKQYQAGTLSDEKYEKLKGINFQFEGIRKRVEKKRKSGDEWELNFALYQNGEKSDVISSWIANNRREFKTGKLTEAKYEKLVGINFPFDIGQKKDDNWEKLFEEWKNGNRKSVKVQQWRQRSIRQYGEDKLSVDKILKLKEVGILK